jgi:hypothetical protein
MQSVYFMYERISAVRSHGLETELVHKKTERHIVPQSYDDIHAVFMRDCTVLSPLQYINDKHITANRPIFIEFQSMDSLHAGETVMVNPADIMSFGGSSNDGGVYITLFSGLLFVVPAELKAFAHAHEQHRKRGRVTPPIHTKRVA